MLGCGAGSDLGKMGTVCWESGMDRLRLDLGSALRALWCLETGKSGCPNHPWKCRFGNATGSFAEEEMVGVADFLG